MTSDFENLMGRMLEAKPMAPTTTTTPTAVPVPTRKPLTVPDTVDYSTPRGLASALTTQGITDPRDQAGVLAQVQAETNFKPRSENLNYSAERLFEIFPKKFKNMEDVKKVVSGGQESIGNRIYGGRMGNKKDEGYKYRGRGFIQLTGKDNYKKYGKRVGVDLIENPDLANDPKIAIQLAAEYLKDRSTNLRSAYHNTKGVAPVNWKTKVKERESYQNKLLEILSQNM